MLFPVAILAGGLATRLRPLTDQIPKALIDINGEPFAAHQLRLLRSQGVERVVFCVAYLSEVIRDFVGDGARFSLSVAYASDGPVLQGTGGAIRRALPLLGDRFFVVYGDSYLPCDFSAIQRAFSQSGKKGLMTVHNNEGRWDTSNVELVNGEIVRYDKLQRSPSMQYIDYGLGLFTREAFDGFDEGPLDLATVYQRLLSRGELAAYEVPERFYEIGSPVGIDDLRAYLARRVAR
jgi:NDP-sugar pyrophosphorylase family protein